MHTKKKSRKADHEVGVGRVNPYGQPDCKISVFFLRLPLVLVLGLVVVLVLVFVCVVVSCECI